MKRVLVLGGSGFVGQRTCRALAATNRFETTVASRRGAAGGVRVDLTEAETFGAMAPFDVVVDCADSLAAPPDDAIAWCLANGVPFLEASADPKTVRRLIERFRNAEARAAARAPVVIGVGLFPGLSNLMAAQLIGDGKPCQRLETAIHYNPLAGAGRGVCRLMGVSMTEPRFWIEGGERHTGPPIGPPATLPFTARRKKAWQVGLPDVDLLRETTSVANIGAYMAPTLPFLPPGLPTLSRLFDGRLARPIEAMSSFAIGLLRSKLLAKRSEPIEMLAVADRGTANERRIIVTVDDGMLAAAATLAVSTEELVSTAPEPGLHIVDEVSQLGPFFERMKTLSEALGFGVAMPEG